MYILLVLTAFLVEAAMAAVIHILNDDVETADTELSKGNSPFHKVSLILCIYLSLSRHKVHDIHK